MNLSTDLNKLLLLVCTFTFIWQSNAQTINAPWTEDFSNAGVLTGATTSGTFFAWADASNSNGARSLLSPLISTTPLTTASLSFFLNSHNEGNANSTLTVEVWDGTAWNNLGIYETNTNGWEEKFITLNSLTITGDIQIRFTFSETSSDFTDDIAIDDVKVD